MHAQRPQNPRIGSSAEGNGKVRLCEGVGIGVAPSGPLLPDASGRTVPDGAWIDLVVTGDGKGGCTTTEEDEDDFALRRPPPNDQWEGEGLTSYNSVEGSRAYNSQEVSRPSSKYPSGSLCNHHDESKNGRPYCDSNTTEHTVHLRKIVNNQPLDSNAYSDWISEDTTDATYPAIGRRPFRLGWDWESYFEGPAVFDDPSSLKILIAPDNAYVGLKEHIESATTSVWIKTYLFNFEPVVELLEDRLENGVHVTLMVDLSDRGINAFDYVQPATCDDNGCDESATWKSEGRYALEAARRLANYECEDPSSCGEATTLFVRDPSASEDGRFHLMHEKIVLVDPTGCSAAEDGTVSCTSGDAAALWGSGNLTHTSFPKPAEDAESHVVPNGNREIYAISDSPRLVKELKDRFDTALNAYDVFSYPGDQASGFPTYADQYGELFNEQGELDPSALGSERWKRWAKSARGNVPVPDPLPNPLTWESLCLEVPDPPGVWDACVSGVGDCKALILENAADVTDMGTYATSTPFDSPYSIASMPEDPVGYEVIVAPENVLQPGRGMLKLLDSAGPGDQILIHENLTRRWNDEWDGEKWNSSWARNTRMQSFFEAAKRGAEVKILIDKADTEWEDQANWTLLKEAACEPGDGCTADDTCSRNETDTDGTLTLCLGKGGTRRIHNKMVLARIADQGYSAIGSLNGHEKGYKVTRELQVIVKSNSAFSYLKAVFNRDWCHDPSTHTDDYCESHALGAMDFDDDGWSDSDEAACGTNSQSGGDEPADADEDGSCDSLDAFSDIAGEDTDTDGDGTGNNADTDDDDDGIADGDGPVPGAIVHLRFAGNLVNSGTGGSALNGELVETDEYGEIGDNTLNNQPYRDAEDNGLLHTGETSNGVTLVARKSRFGKPHRRGRCSNRLPPFRRAAASPCTSGCPTATTT